MPDTSIPVDFDAHPEWRLVLLLTQRLAGDAWDTFRVSEHIEMMGLSPKVQDRLKTLAADALGWHSGSEEDRDAFLAEQHYLVGNDHELLVHRLRYWLRRYDMRTEAEARTTTERIVVSQSLGFARKMDAERDPVLGRH